MAEDIFPADSKTVQELVEDGYKEVPHRYIQRDHSEPIDITMLPSAEIPVIDFKKLASETSAKDDETQKLRSALTSWGCFQLVNHSMENSFLDQVRDLAREFFHLPILEKKKHAREGDGLEGYGNDLFLFEDQPRDWTDRLYLLVSPEDERKLQYWPESPQSFRNVLSAYTDKLREVEEGLLKATSRALGLSEDRFLAQFGERPKMFARFNHYPPCSRPDLVLGLKPHADGSEFTILLQDKQVEGLQLLKDDKWFRVPLMPYSFLVNAGDQLEIMSNGIFKSPVHRALANSERERNTLAIFFVPDLVKEVGPIDELVDEKSPRLFKNVKNYPETYFHYYQQGKRPLDAVRI